jgi:GAF domain-containing protein
MTRSPFPANDQLFQEPAACQDTALTAFAQLCALRLATRRVIITIMSSTVEYVLAEATKSMSLQSDAVEDIRDQRWLGTCSFARGDGINDLAIDGWRKARSVRESPQDKEHYYTSGKSSHYMIVSDVREDPEVAERTFAKQATALRFYFSVPIRDVRGSVVGSLSIMDDKPRYGVSASDMLFCEDMSDTISQHLQNSIVRAQRQRSERLIQALSAFNGSQGSLHDWWLRQDNSTARRGGRYTSTGLDIAEQNVRLDEDFGSQESNLDQPVDASEAISATTQRNKSGAASQESGMTVDERTQEGIAGKDFDNRPNSSFGPSRNVHAIGMYGPSSNTSSQHHGTRPSRQAAGGTSRDHSEHENFDLAELTKQTYARASNLMREALGAEGVVFLNATGNVKSRSGSNSKSSHSSTSGSSSDSRGIAGSDNESSDTSTRATKPCRLAGFSTRTASTLFGTRSLAFELSNRDMSRLIKAYPSGKVFSFEDSGSVYSSSSESATSGGSGVGSDGSKPQARTRHSRHASLLRKVMGEAPVDGFLPYYPCKFHYMGCLLLCDRHNIDTVKASGERWQSCAFLWTSNAARMFEADEDLTYLTAFGHSLAAELCRLETAVSDHAKGIKFPRFLDH